jgi:hypothetical protein
MFANLAINSVFGCASRIICSFFYVVTEVASKLMISQIDFTKITSYVYAPVMPLQRHLQFLELLPLCRLSV